MSTKFTQCLLACIFTLFIFSLPVSAQDFERGTPVPMPEPELNTGGIGNMITGVDFDGNGKTDLYVVAHNWNDDESEMLPRIYKYERNDDDTNWEIVWQASFDVWKQNTWPALTYGDLDGDGKMELIWGPVNWIDATNNPNPVRVIVFESAGDGSHVMGIPDGDNFRPNSTFTIASEDMVNLRPFRWVVEDVDNDGIDELVFSDRSATSSGWYFGILSVDDIPDNGDGSETWTVKANGKTVGLTGAENKWDLAILNDVIYLFDEEQVDRVKWNADSAKFVLLSPLTYVTEGAGSWKSAQVLDIDGNGQKEIIVGSWYTSVVGGHGVWVYEQDGDSLKGSKVADLSPYMSGYGVYGSAVGDIDLNGKMDYVFGSRGATPEGAIFRLEYKGAQDDVANPENWELSLIDSASITNLRWGVIGLGNYDDEPTLEVLYTSSIPGQFGPEPIYVLENLAQIDTGPWSKIDLPWQYVGELINYGAHSIAVDKYDRIWAGGWGANSTLNIYDANGDTVAVIDTIHVKTPAGNDTTFTPSWSRGMKVDPDGNIIYVEDFVLKIGVEELDGLKFQYASGPLLKPGIDSDGYIYAGKVVGINPVIVIDPETFEITQEITLDPKAGFARGMDVSEDGKMMIIGNLDGGVHPLAVYTTEDYVTYTASDTIKNDNQGNPILTEQSITVDRHAGNQWWISQDNAYTTSPDPVNRLIMLDFDTYQYGYVQMPDDGLGPRGMAFSNDGETMYVMSWNARKVYKYTTKGVAIDEKGNGYLPDGFQLRQNYPNPFNPTTEIEFRVARAGKVNLSVYNMLGQKVATLVDSKLPMGDFKVTFDASNLASGTYVYVLKAGDVIIPKKMTFLK